MTFLQWLGVRPREAERAYGTLSGVNQLLTWLNSFSYNGLTYQAPYGVQTLAGEAEPPPEGFEDMTNRAYGGNAVVFAALAVRMQVFSSIRFQWQEINTGRPARLFGNSVLRALEEPEPGTTTQDLAGRMLLDADLAGNWYAIRDTPLPRIGGDASTFNIIRLRPDWVVNVRGERMIKDRQVGYTRLGIGYFEGGRNSGVDPVVFVPGDFAHFAPLPDPLADWRGMSWLTPVARELAADAQMTKHKQKYFENGATPNLIVKYPAGASEDDMKAVQKLFRERYQGVDNAYQTMHIGGGADLTVVGNDMAQVDFSRVQGAGEARIVAASGVPATVLGISEGLHGSSLNAGNYSSARRRFADGTMHPLWQNAAGSIMPLLRDSALLARPSPTGGPSMKEQIDKGFVRLWYDARDIPFLREDARDEADIRQVRATTVRSYVDAGFTPKSAVSCVDTGDMTVLEHTGLFSVQLQPPMTNLPDPNAPPAPPTAPAKPAGAVSPAATQKGRDEYSTP